MSNLDRNAAYLALIEQVKTPKEISYRCLCCKDTGRIDPSNIRRYNLHPVHPVLGGYDEVFLSSPMYLCRSPKCSASVIEVETEQGFKTTSRTAEYALWTTIDASTCLSIHQAEVERWMGSEVRVKESVLPASLRVVDVNSRPVVEAIAKPMPKVEPLQDSPAKPITEYGGFVVGDTVAVSVDHFDKATQREIARNNEAPIGAVGSIKGFRLNPAGLHYGRRTVEPILDIEGQEVVVPLSYLRSVSSEVVA